MSRKEIINEFRNFDTSELQNKYKKIISSKSDKGILFPPYIPFIGKLYDKNRILVYATAQNLGFFKSGNLTEKYTDNYELLVERLYYNSDFVKKYPNTSFTYTNIMIEPVSTGILPSLVGILLYVLLDKTYPDLNDVIDMMTCTNYYKFSLRTEKRDINPNTFNKYHDSPTLYWSSNDMLVKTELEHLFPQFIISFNGRHRQFLSEYCDHMKTIITFVNDPAWILRGGSGCFNYKNKWNWIDKYNLNSISDERILELVEKYIEQIVGIYKKRRREIKFYLLKYYSDWTKIRS